MQHENYTAEQGHYEYFIDTAIGWLIALEGGCDPGALKHLARLRFKLGLSVTEESAQKVIDAAVSTMDCE
jgi:hypothetical protein